MILFEYDKAEKASNDKEFQRFCRDGATRDGLAIERNALFVIISAFSSFRHRVASGNRLGRPTCEGMAAEGSTHLPQYASGFHDALGTVRSPREKARLGLGDHWPRRTRCETMRGSVRAAQYVERVASFPFLGGTPSAHFTPTIKAEQYKQQERAMK